LIFVTTGSTKQSSYYTELISIIDQLIENTRIKDDVIVQAGNSKYRGGNFKEIFDYTDKIESYINAADIVITADGAGTIFSLLKKRKKIIVVDNKFASRYGAPASDFVGGFKESGLLLWCKNVTDIEKYIFLAKNTVFPEYKSPGNTIYEKIVSSYEDWNS